MSTPATTVATDPRTAAVGDSLPEQHHEPTTVQIFRYSAATSNTHRIHYDKDYAATEGYPGILVQSHLHGALVTRLLTDWTRPAGGRLTRLALSIRRYAVPGDDLLCRATVTAIAEDDTGRTIELDVAEARPADDAVCAPGTATVWVPLAGSAS